MSVALSAPDASSGQLQVNGSPRLHLRADSLLEGVAHPATGDRSAVLATMRKFQDEFPGVLSGNGWQKLPSGLLIQWGGGQLGSAGGNEVSVTLPVAFPAAVYAVVASGSSASGAGGVSQPPVISARTTTNLGVIIVQQMSSNGNPIFFHYIVIGR